MKTSFNGHNFYNLFKPLPFLVSDVHFWLWHRCFLRVSPKPSSFGCIFLLWHRCFPLDFTGALFCVSTRNSMKLQILFELCEYLFVLVANRTFLPEFLMLNISFGCCRHSVSNTFVQLTEGRSARDQPKQPPAKKKARPGREGSQGWDHSTNHGKRSMARSLWIYPRWAGPEAEEKQEDDQGG